MNVRMACGVLALKTLLVTMAGAQWSTDAANPLRVADLANEQVQPKIRAAADGGCWVAWFDDATGGYDVRVQRLDREGDEQFTHNGVLVANRAFSSTVDYDLAVDADGNAVLAFNDDRGGGDNITVSKVDRTGNLLWGAGGFGIRLTADAEFKANPRVAPLADGTVVIGWTQDGAFYLQRLDELGAPMWSGYGSRTSDPGHQLTLSDLHADGEGGVLAMWVRTETPSFLSSKGLRMQKFDEDGVAVWPAPSIVYPSTADGVVPTKSIQNGYFPTFSSDGAGGAVVAWYDNGTSRNAWLQRINADGSRRFAGDGLAGAASATQIRLSASGAFDSHRGVYYLGFTTSNSTQTRWGYNAQRFESDGSPTWGAAGRSLLPLTSVQSSFDRALVTDDGVEFFLFENCCGGPGRLVGWRLDDAGNQLWTPSPLIASATNTSKSRLDVVRSAAGGSLLAWSDGNAAPNILAQNVNPDGSLGPPACRADVSGSSDPNSPDYGSPDGLADASDFFYYLDQFAAGNLAVADLSASSDPSDPGYGVPDGVLDASDFFFYLDIFAAGCP